MGTIELEVPRDREGTFRTALRRRAGDQRGGRVRLSHEGLRQASQEAFSGLIWQRCQAHFRRIVLDRTPSDYRDRMQDVLNQIPGASSQAEAQERFDVFRTEIEENASSVLEILEEGFFDATAVLALPGKYRRRLRTANLLERFIEEIRRRGKGARIFPKVESA